MSQLPIENCFSNWPSSDTEKYGIISGLTSKAYRSGYQNYPIIIGQKFNIVQNSGFFLGGKGTGKFLNDEILKVLFVNSTFTGGYYSVDQNLLDIDRSSDPLAYRCWLKCTGSSSSSSSTISDSSRTKEPCVKNNIYTNKICYNNTLYYNLTDPFFNSHINSLDNQGDQLFLGGIQNNNSTGKIFVYKRSFDSNGVAYNLEQTISFPYKSEIKRLNNIKVSKNGKVLAAISPYNFKDGNNDVSLCYLYKRFNNTGSWELYQTISGFGGYTNSFVDFGDKYFSLDLDYSGHTIAIGNKNLSKQIANDLIDGNSVVNVYTGDLFNNKNYKLAASITGKYQTDFGREISINGLGNKIAVYSFDENLNQNLRVYMGNLSVFSKINNEWKLNYKIIPELLPQYYNLINFGRSLDFNFSGNILAVGGKVNQTGTLTIYETSGLQPVKIYETLSSGNFGYYVKSNLYGDKIFTNAQSLKTCYKTIETFTSISGIWYKDQVLSNPYRENRNSIQNFDINGEGSILVVGSNLEDLDVYSETCISETDYEPCYQDYIYCAKNNSIDRINVSVWPRTTKAFSKSAQISQPFGMALAKNLKKYLSNDQLGPRSLADINTKQLFIVNSDYNNIAIVSAFGCNQSYIFDYMPPVNSPGDLSGPITGARFNKPKGIAVDKNNTIYLTDTNNHKIKKIQYDEFYDDYIVSTYVGGYILSNDMANSITPPSDFFTSKSGDLDGVLSETLLNQPYGICMDESNDEIYFTDYGNHKIKKIGLDGIVTTIAGNGSPGYENGIGTSAQFNGPKGIAIDSSRRILYVADSNNQIIRNINLKTNNVDLFAGIPFTAGDSTGDLYSTKFNNPEGIFYIKRFNALIVADSNNNKAKRISIFQKNVTDYITEINGIKNIIYDKGENTIDTDQAELIYYEEEDSWDRGRNLGCSIDCTPDGNKIIFGAEFNKIDSSGISEGKAVYSGVNGNKINIFPDNTFEGKRFGYDVSVNNLGNVIAISSLNDISFYNINSQITSYTLINRFVPNAPGPYSVALSQDGTKAIIGAGYNLNQIGRAYLYDTINNNIIYTFSGDNQLGDQFGFDVDISSNDNFILIGAPKNLNSQCEIIPNSTTKSQYYPTFVSSKNGEAGILAAYYPKSCIGQGDYPANYIIDWNLSEVGCVDAGKKPDGTTAIGQNGAIGRLIAPTYDQFSIGMATYAHRHDGRIYSMSAKNKTTMLTEFNNAYNNYLSNNPFEGVCKPEGAAFVFKRIGNSWSNWSGQKILGRNSRDDYFGNAVSIDSEGKNLVVGAKNENNNGPFVGSIYIYYKTFDDRWFLSSRKFGCEKSNYFGTDVKINSDGNMILASAPANDLNGINAGVVYGYKKIDNYWQQTDFWGGRYPSPECVLQDGYDYCILYAMSQNFFGQKLCINNSGTIGYAGEPGRQAARGGIYRMFPLGEGLKLPCGSSSSSSRSSIISSSSSFISSSSSSSEIYESSSSCAFTSMTASAYIGDTISIVGANFANMKVTFCGCFNTPAEILYKTNNLLQVKVPECAKSGPVVINVNNKTCVFEKDIKIHRINKIYPESGRISVISDFTKNSPNFLYYTPPTRIDTLTVKIDQIPYCKPTTDIELDYFGNILKYDPKKSTSNSWNDLTSLYNLIKTISFGSSGLLDVSGNISGYLYPGYLLKDCRGCIKKLEINRLDDYASTGEIKIYYDNINLLKDSTNTIIELKDMNQNNFIKFNNQFSGNIFSYSKNLSSATSQKTLNILSNPPFYVSGLYLNSKKVLGKYDQNNLIDFGSGKINEDIYKDKPLLGYLASTDLSGKYKEIFGDKIFEDEKIIPYNFYGEEIYQSIYSGNEPYFYEKNKNSLPGAYAIYSNSEDGQIIKYFPKIYKISAKKHKENINLPKSGEKHILLFDVNLYGISEWKPEECDQEINVYVLEESDFNDIVKNPSLANLTITDLNHKITGIISNPSQIIQQKNLLDEFSVKNNIITDTSFYQGNSYASDFNMLKMDIKIRAPSKTCPQTVGQFYFFEYTGFKNSDTVHNYKLLVRQNNNTIAEGSYITGEKTGYMINLLPGDYTLILSGMDNQNQFIYN